MSPKTRPGLPLPQKLPAPVSYTHLDLLRKAVEVRVAIDVEPRQYLHQVQDIGDQGTVEARLWFVQPIHHVGDHLAEALPEVFSSDVYKRQGLRWTGWPASYVSAF